MKLNLKKGYTIIGEDTAYIIDGEVSLNRHGNNNNPLYYTWRVPAYQIDHPEKKVYLKLTDKESYMYQFLHKESMFKIRFPYIEYIEDSFETEIEVDGTEKTFFVVAAEFIDGVTLDKYIQSKNIHSRMTLEDAEEQQFRLILQLLYAVDAYSSCRFGQDCMTHRDLKPTNLMVTKKEEYLVLIDFDWAHIPNEDSYVERDQKQIAKGGTRGYGDPRNWRRVTGEVAHSDIKMDIYSIAMLVYYIMSGEDYFNTQKEKENYTNIQCFDLAYRFDFHKIPGRHPFRHKKYAPVHEIIRKAMAPVEERYTSVRDIIVDFEAFLKSYYGDESTYQRLFSFKELLDVPKTPDQNAPNKMLCRYYDMEHCCWRDITLSNHQSSILYQNKGAVLSVYNRNGDLICYPYNARTSAAAEKNGTVILSTDDSVVFETNRGTFEIIRILY